MSRKLLTIKYKGTNYHGWQVQKNGVSVQQKVCEALKKLYSRNVNATGCSRTDSGVHALKYCLHFDDCKSLDNSTIVAALNSYLPNDIAAVSCKSVNQDFHARYSVKQKTYIYKLYSGTRDPFLEGLAYHYKGEIDIDKMNKFAKSLTGTHDFAAFCSSKTTVKSTVRTIFDASVSKKGNIITLKFTADGFLYNMVRILVGTLIYVSEGKIDVDDAKKIIASRDRKNAGKTVPAHGLYLFDVKY